MSYIKRAISGNEKLLYITRPHWIYVFKGLSWLCASTAIGFLIQEKLYYLIGHNARYFVVDFHIMRFDEIYTPFPLLGLLMGVVMFWSYFSIYVAHEVGLTNQRYIHKKGLFIIKLDQVDLEDIRGENLDHGLLGWLLGYGYVQLDSRFINDIYLPAIHHPYKMVRKSHIARRYHPDIDYTEVILDRNLKDLEQRENAARAKAKIKNLKEKVLAGFKSAA